MTTTQHFEIRPIGYVRLSGDRPRIDLIPEFAAGLHGLAQFSHIWVLYWFHANDTPKQRNTLQVHPCGNPKNPLTGVFATHSPVRPNPIAMTCCRLVKIDGLTLTIDTIDAYDESPVIDIKSYFPPKIDPATVSQPTWEGRLKPT